MLLSPPSGRPRGERGLFPTPAPKWDSPGGRAAGKNGAARPSARPAAAVLFVVLAAPLFPKTLVVPRDFPTIRSAVQASAEGDTVEVETGLYQEGGIVIDKAIRLKSKEPFGAIVYAPDAGSGCIFQVRAAADIEGFILKNAYVGIEQRNSPDVEWTGRDLVLLNMTEAAVSINDMCANIGKAFLRGIIIENARAGVVTNDANGVDIGDCLIVDCDIAFGGLNHLYFNVDRARFWNCKLIFHIQDHPRQSVLPVSGGPGAGGFTIGEDIAVLDSWLSKKNGNPGRPAAGTGILAGGGALPAGGKNRSRLEEGLGLNILGNIHLKQKDYRRARLFYKNSLALGRRAGSEEMIWKANQGLAAVHEARGELEKAVEHYKQAVCSIDRLSEALPLRIYRSGFLSDKLHVYNSLIDLLLRMSVLHPERGHEREAFCFAEISKASSFYDNLLGLMLDLKSGMPEDIAGRETALRREISSIQIRLQDPKNPPEEQERWLLRLNEAEADYRDLMAHVRLRNPAVLPIVRFTAGGYGDLIGGVLDHETALVEYVAGETRSHAFLIAKDTIRAIPLPGSETIGRLVRNYLRFLTLREGKDFCGAQGGKILYDVLLAPFGDILSRGVRKLVIVPDGALYYLPFEALIASGNGKNGKVRYLIEDCEIVYAPSAACLANLRERENGKAREPGILIIANPEIRKDSRIARSRGLSRLGFAAREIKSITRSLPDWKKSLLFNGQATEAEFKGRLTDTYEIIHFVAHGFYNDQNWERTALVLQRERDSIDDGLLQPIDIYHLDLKSDMVVLSACQTGKGRLAKGEGVLGFSLAFMAAGARSVLSSLWNINDESTSRFMGYFYGHLARGESKARALRSSKMRMLESEFGHPRHWAAFVLFGDDSPLAALR